MSLPPSLSVMSLSPHHQLVLSLVLSLSSSLTRDSDVLEKNDSVFKETTKKDDMSPTNTFLWPFSTKSEMM